MAKRRRRKGAGAIVGDKMSRRANREKENIALLSAKLTIRAVISVRAGAIVRDKNVAQG